MDVAVFSSKPYDRMFLDRANGAGRHALTFHDVRLTAASASLAAGAAAVSVFVNDRLDDATLAKLAEAGVRIVALRCAGYNNVDLAAARRHGIAVCRVPTYSPAAVAEHAIALILALDRKIHRAHNRIREGNFALDGLVGFNLEKRTVGVVGTGGIGTAMARILAGFGCEVLATDLLPNPELLATGVRYVPSDELFAQSDIVSLHCPLNSTTRHFVNADVLARAKPGFMLVNTGRGGLVDTKAAVDALKSGRLGSLAIDVYEGEESLFFEDRSGQIIQDDLFARLLTFPNVLITGHQAFLTEEALTAIATTTIANLDAFAASGSALHQL